MIAGLLLTRLLVITSRYPNTEVMLTRTIRTKKSVAHSQPVLMVAMAVSMRVMVANHTPWPVMDTRAGSDTRFIRLIAAVL